MAEEFEFEPTVSADVQYTSRFNDASYAIASGLQYSETARAEAWNRQLDNMPERWRNDPKFVGEMKAAFDQNQDRAKDINAEIAAHEATSPGYTKQITQQMQDYYAASSHPDKTVRDALEAQIKGLEEGTAATGPLADSLNFLDAVVKASGDEFKLPTQLSDPTKGPTLAELERGATTTTDADGKITLNGKPITSQQFMREIAGNEAALRDLERAATYDDFGKGVTGPQKDSRFGAAVSATKEDGVVGITTYDPKSKTGDATLSRSEAAEVPATIYGFDKVKDYTPSRSSIPYVTKFESHVLGEDGKTQPFTHYSMSGELATKLTKDNAADISKAKTELGDDNSGLTYSLSDKGKMKGLNGDKYDAVESAGIDQKVEAGRQAAQQAMQAASDAISSFWGGGKLKDVPNEDLGNVDMSTVPSGPSNQQQGVDAPAPVPAR